MNAEYHVYLCFIIGIPAGDWEGVAVPLSQNSHHFQACAKLFGQTPAAKK